ncbi:hypothetical protein B0H12DRAFT_1081079, partial [Mycena haematopus]
NRTLLAVPIAPSSSSLFSESAPFYTRREPRWTASSHESLAPVAPRPRLIERFWRRARQPQLTPAISLTPVTAGSAALDKKTRPTPPLMIMKAQTLTLQKTLQRDPEGLYNNKKEMNGFKNLIVTVLVGLAFIVIVVVVIIALQKGSDRVAIWGLLSTLYVAMMLYHLLELLVGTMYLKREGWIFLENAEWFDGGKAVLGEEDSQLKKLRFWGSRQLVPTWEPPQKDPRRPETFVPTKTGKLVNLNSGDCVDAIVTEAPDFVVPVAYHGVGVTCMLLKRTKNDSKHPMWRGKKVGMANFPPTLLYHMDKEADRTIIVGSSKSTKKPAPAGAARRERLD